MDITIRQATTKDFATIQSLNQLLCIRLAYGKNEHAIHFYDATGFTLWEVGMERKL